MKKLIGLIFILSLSSCSYITDFYIFNTTDQNIIVTYQVRNLSDSDPFVTDPRIVGFDSCFEIVEIKKAYEYEFNSENKTITCELKSGQAIWIGEDLNFTLDDPEEALTLGENLLELKIEQKGTSLINANSENITNFFERLELQVVGIKVKNISGNTRMKNH